MIKSNKIIKNVIHKKEGQLVGIDLKVLKEKKAEIQMNIVNRAMKINLDDIIKLSDKRLSLLAKVETDRARRNEIASKMKGRLDDKTRGSLIEEGKELKEKIVAEEKELEEIELKYNISTKTIPNFADPDAPIGTEENGDSKVIKTVGKLTKFKFKPKDHLEIAKLCDIIDFDTATKVTGQKFYYLKNEAVLLELALEQYVMSLLVKKGFVPFLTPDLAKADVVGSIGFVPRGEESNIYCIEDTDMCLVGTAEITLGGYYAKTVIPKEKLPLRMVGLSHCFRKEAGAAGQFSKGLYRVHQFSKVEMFSITDPKDSKKEHQFLLSCEEEIFSSLGLPYHVLDICTGDLGASAARKFDVEAWMPGRGDGGEYGEVTSTSNCTDFQSRALNIKYSDKKTASSSYVHTLNGTAVAISRALVAILENYQNEDGSVSIPKVLIPYMGGIKEIKVKK